MSRTFPTSRGSAWRRDWLADDAVYCEPVSAPNSLLTGKNTGKFAKLGPSQLLHCLVVSVFRPLWPNFPKQSNREFWARKQGSYYPEQGSHSASSRPRPRANHKRLRGRSRKKRLRVFLATIAKTSMWQKANRNECLVTQTIGIALTRCN
jgi:hypothetical protein